MTGFRTRYHQQRGFVYSWFFLIVLAVILVFSIRGAYASFIKKQNANAEREKYQEEREILETKRQELQDRIERMNTERGLEEELRKRYNVTKEGEVMIRIIE